MQIGSLRPVGEAAAALCYACSVILPALPANNIIHSSVQHDHSQPDDDRWKHGVIFPSIVRHINNNKMLKACLWLPVSQGGALHCVQHRGQTGEASVGLQLGAGHTCAPVIWSAPRCSCMQSGCSGLQAMAKTPSHTPSCTHLIALQAQARGSCQSTPDLSKAQSYPLQTPAQLHFQRKHSLPFQVKPAIAAKPAIHTIKAASDVHSQQQVRKVGGVELHAASQQLQDERSSRVGLCTACRWR